MPTSDEDLAYLWDMLEAARNAVEIASGTDKAARNQDRVIRLVVERGVEILGEAARHVSQAAQAEAWWVLGDRLTLLSRDDVDNVVTLVRRAS